MAQNPFLIPSALPYQLPPFAEITDEHYRPAFEEGMRQQREEIDAIAGDQDAPAFENTMLPLERSGQVLQRVAAVFFNKASSDSTDFTNDLEEELAPLLSAHSDAITLDARLYRRIDDLWGRVDELGLDAESRYLVERHHTEFT